MQSETEAAKRSYRAALSNLENISAEIHEKRRQQAMRTKRFASVLNKSMDDVISDVTNMAQVANFDVVGPKVYGM